MVFGPGKKNSKKGRKIARQEEGDSEGFVTEEEEDDLDDEGSESEHETDGTRKIRDEVMSAKYPVEDIKLVCVVREDLKMGKGKIGA